MQKNVTKGRKGKSQRVRRESGDSGGDSGSGVGARSGNQKGVGEGGDTEKRVFSQRLLQDRGVNSVLAGQAGKEFTSKKGPSPAVPPDPWAS